MEASGERKAAAAAADTFVFLCATLSGFDWSATKPWRHGRWKGVKKGGSEMQGVDGRVKWGGQRAVSAPAKMQPGVLPLQSFCSYS